MDGVTQLLMRQQPELLERFQRTIQEKRLVHAYLFEGARGTGKEELARWIAQTLFCDELQDGQPCGHCNHCLRIAAGEFPDVAEISPDGNTIKVNQVRELKAELSKSGMEGSRKVYLIYDAEKMTVSASNSLLTFLEEPQNDTYLILMTTAKENILPTIRSRCQIVHFQVVNKQALGETLEAQGIQHENAALLAAITNNQEEALLLNQEERFHESKKRTWAWFQLMTDKNPQAFVFVQTDLMDGLKDKNDGHFFWTCYYSITVIYCIPSTAISKLSSTKITEKSTSALQKNCILRKSPGIWKISSMERNIWKQMSSSKGYWKKSRSGTAYR